MVNGMIVVHRLHALVVVNVDTEDVLRKLLEFFPHGEQHLLLLQGSDEVCNCLNTVAFMFGRGYSIGRAPSQERMSDVPVG